MYATVNSDVQPPLPPLNRTRPRIKVPLSLKRKILNPLNYGQKTLLLPSRITKVPKREEKKVTPKQGPCSYERPSSVYGTLRSSSSHDSSLPSLCVSVW